MKRLKQYKYKVVKKDTKTSAMIRNHNIKYCRYYKPRTSVYADDNTYGIFVFKTKKEAKKWMSKYTRQEYIIIRVLPIGRAKTPHLISQNLTTEGIESHYDRKATCKKLYCVYPPKGTITYPGVYVVD